MATPTECPLVDSAFHERMRELEERMETRFKGIEINMAAGFATVAARQDVANSSVLHLREAEIRRDEREKTRAETLAGVQTTSRWWLVTAMGAVALLVTAADRLLP